MAKNILITFLRHSDFCILGDPIHCNVENDNIDKDTVEAFCWIHGAYHIPKKILNLQKNLHYSCQKTSPEDSVAIYIAYFNLLRVENLRFFQ